MLSLLGRQEMEGHCEERDQLLQGLARWDPGSVWELQRLSAWANCSGARRGGAQAGGGWWLGGEPPLEPLRETQEGFWAREWQDWIWGSDHSSRFEELVLERGRGTCGKTTKWGKDTISKARGVLFFSLKLKVFIFKVACVISAHVCHPSQLICLRRMLEIGCTWKLLLLAGDFSNCVRLVGKLFPMGCCPVPVTATSYGCSAC